MLKEKISEEEKTFIRKKFNKSLWISLVVMPFILFVMFLPVYLLVFMLLLFVFNMRIDNLFTIYAVLILMIVFLDFLYGKIIVNNKISNKEIDKITDVFLIQKKDNYSYVSETASTSNYFRLYLINENKEKKGIYISSEDYRKVKENETITIIYFGTVNIIKNAVYKGADLNDVTFFLTKKWRFL